MKAATFAIHAAALVGSAIGCLLAAPLAIAQPGAPAPSPREAAAFDMTGHWVAVVTEDWKFRMVTPRAGEYAGIPLNAEGRRIADGWDPAGDEASGEQCKAYGAANFMRLPGRLRIAWEDDATLRIDIDAGSQTRLLRFGPAAPAGESWQGHSLAEWQAAAAEGDARAGSGSLEVVTTRMRPGYLRKNGVPYSGNAVLTEYFNYLTAPNGDEWLIVTAIVDDPAYLNRPYVTSSNFKKLPDDAGWNPTPCSAT